MKTRRIMMSFFILSLAVLAATAGAQTLRINSGGIGVDSGSTESYMNFGSSDGASGYGFRDNNGTLEFKNESGAGWMAFGSSAVWKSTTAGSLEYLYPAAEETDSDPNAWVCIGNQTPLTLLHIYDFDEDYDLQPDDTDSHKPQIYVLQDGAGDASLAFRLDYSGEERLYFTLGIDQRFELNETIPELKSTDFKICRDYFDGGTVPGDLGDLDGEEDYDSDKMMMRIHSGVPVMQAGKRIVSSDSTGIVDFNQQSRARRYYWTSEQPVSTRPGKWTPILFNATSWDEHSEMRDVPCDEYQTMCTRFVALEEGYYQVNARVELDLASLEPAQAQEIKSTAGYLDSYVSIAIFHATLPMAPVAAMHSQGNNLQIVIGSYGVDEYLPLYRNNAPNVSDIVHLEKDEGIEIRVWQDTAGPLPLKELVEPEMPEDNAPFNYFSVHKSS